MPRWHRRGREYRRHRGFRWVPDCAHFMKELRTERTRKISGYSATPAYSASTLRARLFDLDGGIAQRRLGLLRDPSAPSNPTDSIVDQSVRQRARLAIREQPAAAIPRGAAPAVRGDLTQKRPYLVFREMAILLPRRGNADPLGMPKQSRIAHPRHPEHLGDGKSRRRIVDGKHRQTGRALGLIHTLHSYSTSHPTRPAYPPPP